MHIFLGSGNMVRRHKPAITGNAAPILYDADRFGWAAIDICHIKSLAAPKCTSC